MSKKSVIPDAWDDDWESLVDEGHGVALDQNNIETTKLNKAERLAQHDETNKKIWRSAEEASTYHFLTVHDNVPFKSEFKPALTLLSRRPVPRMIEMFDPITGLSKLTIENDQDEGEPQIQPTTEELRLKAQRDREEKQKKYETARARILGTTSNSSSHQNDAVINATPYEELMGTRTHKNGRGSGRKIKSDAKPENHTLRKAIEASNSKQRENKGIIRAPRGPDPSARGGSGFTKRGGRLH